MVGGEKVKKGGYHNGPSSDERVRYVGESRVVALTQINSGSRRGEVGGAKTSMYKATSGPQWSI
jgi:hypothetical protein